MSRVLVAEDNLPNRELIREILKAWAHEVIEAEDGQQALDKIAETKPELVLLDIQMSVLDGYAVVRQLRQRTSCPSPSLKVVALTAFAMQGDRERVLQSGLDGYLIKPIDMLCWAKSCNNCYPIFAATRRRGNGIADPEKLGFF
jgi:CheY-like chemotaxis protein